MCDHAACDRFCAPFSFQLQFLIHLHFGSDSPNIPILSHGAFDDSLNYLDIFSHFEQFDGNKLLYLKVFDVYQLSLVHGRFEWFRPNNNRSSDLNCMLNKIIHFVQKQQKKIFRKWWNSNQNKWLYIQIINDLFWAFGFSICGSWNKITTTWYVCK